MPYLKPKTTFDPASIEPSPIPFPSVDPTPSPSTEKSETETMNEDLPTPRPSSHSPSLDDLSSALASTSMVDPVDNVPPAGDTRPALDDPSTVMQADLDTSKSSASVSSLSTGGSQTEGDTTASDSEPNTPPTTGTPESLTGALDEDPVMRYKEGLYAYTRALYLQAKLSQNRKEEAKAYYQFGLKQSGMEKMAAKKALARRLNA